MLLTNASSLAARSSLLGFVKYILLLPLPSFQHVEQILTLQDIVEKLQKEQGNPLAKRVNIIHKEMPVDDPQRRRPDTTRAKETLGWQPRWSVSMGVEEVS